MKNVFFFAFDSWRENMPLTCHSHLFLDDGRGIACSDGEVRACHGWTNIDKYSWKNITTASLPLNGELSTFALDPT